MKEINNNHNKKILESNLTEDQVFFLSSFIYKYSILTISETDVLSSDDLLDYPISKYVFKKKKVICITKLLFQNNFDTKSKEEKDEMFKIVISHLDELYYIISLVREFNAFFKVTLSEAQISSSIFLFVGLFVELMTGSGKTFAISLASILFIKLEKRRVHVATFTDYLSSRDLNELNSFYNYLNIRSSNLSNADLINDDLVYGSMSKFVFNYLSLFENVNKLSEITEKKMDVIILDESDGILIEKDLVPHILNTFLSLGKGDFAKRNKLNRITSKQLKELIDFVEKNFVLSKDFFLDAKRNVLFNTTNIINKVNKMLDMYRLNEFPSFTYFLVLSIIRSLNRKINVDYMIGINEKTGKEDIIIINSVTGERELNSRYTDFGTDILEIKHGLKNINDEPLLNNVKFNMKMNIYTYLRLYKMCVGISGTNLEISTLINSLFMRKVVEIKHIFKEQKKNVFLNFFSNKEEKMIFLIKKIKEIYPQPIIVLTDDSNSNQYVYQNLKKNLKFLNKNNFFYLEAMNELIKSNIIDKKAGKKGNVVIATNILSRGVDIQVKHIDEKVFKFFLSYFKYKESIFNIKIPNKLYIFDLIVNLIKFELDKFDKENNKLAVFVFQPYLDRRLDKQAAGRTARMGADGDIYKLFSFDDKIITDVYKQKSPLTSMTSFYVGIFKFLTEKKSNFFLSIKNIEKHLFLLVSRLQNIEYVFSSFSKEDEKYNDLLINNFVKNTFVNLHTDKIKMKTFLFKMKDMMLFTDFAKKKFLFLLVDDEVKKYNIRSIGEMIDFLLSFLKKNEDFIKKQDRDSFISLSGNLLAYWNLIESRVACSYEKGAISDRNVISTFLLDAYVIMLNSILYRVRDFEEKKNKI